MMPYLLLTFSLLANVLFAYSNSFYQDRYQSLLVWACEHGNGGHECGER